MPSTYTTNGGIELPANGEQSATWGNTVNDNMNIIDRLTNGVGSIALSGTTHTLTTTDGTPSDGHYSVLALGGSPSGTNTITVSPNDGQHLYIVKNASGQIVTFTQGSGANVSVANNTSKIIYADGAGSGAAIVDITANLDLGAIILNGAAITSSAAEINKLDGMTSSKAELNILTGVTSSAAEINKLDNMTSSKAELNILTGVTATPANVNTLALGGTANGTAVASKAVVLDAAKDYTGVRNLTIVGELDAATGDFSGNVDVGGAFSLSGTAISSTAAEINFVAGVTSAIQSQLNALTAATAAAVPAGAVNSFAMNSAPTGWLNCDGATISRTTYSVLFAAIGTTYGAGDGTSTFLVPDLRGEFLRGWDNGRGVDASRAFGSNQGDAIRNILAAFGNIRVALGLSPRATATGAAAVALGATSQDNGNGGAAVGNFTFDASRTVPTAADNRPRNIALLFCIKI